MPKSATEDAYWIRLEQATPGLPGVLKMVRECIAFCLDAEPL